MDSIVSWLNHKQWQMDYTSDLMMIVRYSKGVLRPSHTAQNSRKRMNHAQNLVVRACPSRIWPFLLTYSIFQNQGTPFSSCLADATRRLASPGVASACLALRCLARQDEPRPILSAGSDIWLLAQVVYGIVHNAKCINIPFFSVRQTVFLYKNKCLK